MNIDFKYRIVCEQIEGQMIQFRCSFVGQEEQQQKNGVRVTLSIIIIQFEIFTHVYK